MEDTIGGVLKKLAVVCEDLSHPLDEGFKKASSSLLLAIAGLGTGVTVFSRKAQGQPFTPRGLPDNKLLLGSGLARGLAEAQPDAVLYIPEAAATPMSLVRARTLARYARPAPVAVLSLQRRVYRGPARWLAKYVAPDLVLVLSERSRAEAARAGLRAQIVPLGVDAQAFKPAGPGEKAVLRRKYGVPDGKIILHVGHITRRRNLELARQALRQGRHLVVVASTSTRACPEVRQALEGAPVIFLDRYVEKISEVYSLADCYVFPTLSDTGAIEIPLSVLEAMATDLAVVTTTFGGLGDLFPNRPAYEEQGLYLARTEAEFAAGLEKALALASAATRGIVLNLSWEHAATRVLEAIDMVVAGRVQRERS